MLRRLDAAVRIAARQLGHYRVRSALAVVAVALAVLSTTLLAGVGVGVLVTGQEKLDAAGRDLWVTGGPVRLVPGSAGGIQTGISDAHGTATAIEARDDVAKAVPIAFQTVYAGTDPGELRTLVAVGVRGGGPSIAISRGTGLQGGDVHYADGTYDGPMTREVLVDERTAALFHLEPGDSLYVGGTVSNARANRATVIGVSPTFSRFVGAPTVVMRLSELQTLSGTAGRDRASLVTVTVAPGADPTEVAADLEAAYPAYEVRTNREQLEAVLAARAATIAAGTTLVVVAVLSGVALTANTLALSVHHQRRELAALEAAGVAPGTLVGVLGAQAGLVGLLGGLLGLAATPLAARAVDVVALRIVGFSGLVRTPTWVFLVGLGVAVGISLVGATVAGWRVTRISPLSHLQ